MGACPFARAGATRFGATLTQAGRKPFHDITISRSIWRVRFVAIFQCLFPLAINGHRRTVLNSAVFSGMRNVAHALHISVVDLPPWGEGGQGYLANGRQPNLTGV